MASLVQSRAFPGNVQQFRAAMQRLYNRLGTEGWRSSDGRRLVLGEYPYMQGMYHFPISSDDLNGTFSVFDWKPDCDEIASKTSVKRPTTRASWQVLLWPKSSMRPLYHPTKGIYSAGIEAYEEANNCTHVRFLDGYDPEKPLRQRLEIGSAFAEFCNWVIEETWPMPPHCAEEGMGKMDLAKLRQMLAEHFNVEELRTLCFDLRIEHENLSSTLDGMTRELVSYCKRHGRISELIEALKQQRPKVPWGGMTS
jgi:hypothetical protein